ncbi:MAG: hypothetical protein JSV10_09655 [Candidatus Zixiibacteriota bacterium]|nr:MAG: hypothetical protein JSV10_09655 [candidate division Zixibacteria bacterium]
MRRLQLQAMTALLLFVSVLALQANASTAVENNDQPFSFRNDLAQGDLEQAQKIFRLSHASYLAYEGDPAKGEQALDVYGFKGKSVKRAFLYSLIVPGSGEFYGGSKIKAAIFFGLDAAFWALYFNYHGKGKDKETEYKKFADVYWSEDEYTQWLIDSLNITSDLDKYYNRETKDSAFLSHHLPDTKTDQYYEMIGKYEQFASGWKDYDGPLPPYHEVLNPSPTWNQYRDMRELSNDWLNKAKYSAMASLGNHILSAFDAAFTVKRYNKRGEKFSQVELKMRLVERNQELIPRLSASLRF